MPKFVHDQRTGAGYGFTGRKGFQTNPSVSGNLFPYNSGDSSDEEDLDDEFMNLKASINKKVSYSNLAKEPSPFSRTDRFTMSKNRLNLAENDNPISILQGIVPFPMRGFDGPAMGGSSENPAFRVKPGRIDGSPYGWTKGMMFKSQEEMEGLNRFLDAIDPELREKTKMKLKIARIK